MTDQLNDPATLSSLRVGLEAWEHEAAAVWEGIIRSPHVLRRIGHQLDECLAARQRIESALRRGFASTANNIHETPASELTELRQLEAHLTALAARLERLERQFNHD